MPPETLPIVWQHIYGAFQAFGIIIITIALFWVASRERKRQEKQQNKLELSSAAHNYLMRAINAFEDERIRMRIIVEADKIIQKHGRMTEEAMLELERKAK